MSESKRNNGSWSRNGSPDQKMDAVGTGADAPSKAVSLRVRVWRRYQQVLDLLSPLLVPRWVVAVLYLVLYCLRAFTIQGWYIVTYGLGIYLLNLLLAFLSPKIDPAVVDDEEDNEDGPQLPTAANEEFRPFIRRLPEFKFWHRLMVATTVAFAMTFFRVFDIPVFWPVLVVYFCVLFFLTMKRQIMHMIKFRYLPFTHGKRRYRGKDDSGKVVTS